MMVLMLCIGSVSCSDDEYTTRIHELLLKKEYTFEPDEETGDLTTIVKFRNEDLSNYKANPDADWCTVDIDVSASTMTITVEENNSFDERTSTVTLLDTKDGKSSRTFTVKQAQNDVIRVVDGESTTYEVGTDGGQVVIHLESNVSYTVKIDEDADWITLPSGIGTRGLQQSQVILDVARNNTETARSANVVIKNEASGAQQIVLISQAFKAYMTVLKTEYTIDEKGGDVNIYIQTNISFDVYTTEEDTWVVKKSRESINDNTVCQKLSIAPFSEKSAERSSTVSIENVSHSQSHTVTITQTRNIFIEEEKITILKGSSQKLTLYNANGDDVKWESNDSTVAKVDDAGEVTGVDTGSTIIKVSSSDGLHTDNVSVTVEQPSDLAADLANEWQQGYTQYDDLQVLTSLKNTITNNSQYDLMITRATLYCDSVVMTNTEYNESTGLLSVGKSKEFKTDIPVERESSTIVRDTTYNDDGVMVITERTIEGKVKENNHKYILVWEYTYSNETFTYRCTYPEEEKSASDARKKSARRARTRRR